MKRIMFVCLGNICRSPMAEFIFKDMVKQEGLESEFYISSSATSTDEIYQGIGNPVYPPAARELAKTAFPAKERELFSLSGKITKNTIFSWVWTAVISAICILF